MSDDKPETTEIAGGVKQEEIKPPLQVQVGMENGKVIFIFSQLLTTFTLPWDEAEKMADAIYHHAAEAREAREKSET